MSETMDDLCPQHDLGKEFESCLCAPSPSAAPARNGYGPWNLPLIDDVAEMLRQADDLGDGHQAARLVKSLAAFVRSQSPVPHVTRAEDCPPPKAVPGQLHPHAGLLAEVEQRHRMYHDKQRFYADSDACIDRECRLAAALRAASPSPGAAQREGRDVGETTWTKLQPYEGRAHQGCTNCPTPPKQLSMEARIAVGFGYAGVTKDGAEIHSEQPDDEWEDAKQLAEFEAMAAADPDHDWRAIFDGPLHGETFQRHGDGQWIMVASTGGFA